jgi:hypothetical protein
MEVRLKAEDPGGTIYKYRVDHLFPEVGTPNFFLSLQSQLRNLKEALPQSQFRNFLKNVAPQLQLRNSAIAIFSEFRNLRALLPQFSADVWGREA